MDNEIKTIIAFLRDDKGAQKHAYSFGIWRMRYPGEPSEIRVYWDSRNFNTVRPVIKRLTEAHADKFARAGFVSSGSAFAPYLSVLLDN